MLTYEDNFSDTQSYGLIASANYFAGDGSLLYASVEVKCEADRFVVTLNVYDEAESLKAVRRFAVYPAMNVFAQ